MVDLAAFRLLLTTLAGWLTSQQQELIAYLIDENRILRAQLGDRRVRLTDAERCRLAVRGHLLGCTRLSQVAMIVTPDTILRWHRQLIARKWTYVRRRPGRPGVRRAIHELIARMAHKNPRWGYARIQGALKNLGHRVARSTIARVLKSHGLPPVPERPTSWQTFLRAHWGAIAGADLFTTEVWTWRGLVTYYTGFVIDLASRRARILSCTPHPDTAFMCQVTRGLTAAAVGFLVGHRVLICDRDRTWTAPMRQLLEDAGIRVVRTPFQAPNANACAERFVRSIKAECLDRIVPLGERHLRQTMHEFVAHYHGERNHQGIGNELIDGSAARHDTGRIRRRQRLGGLLNYYNRAA